MKSRRIVDLRNSKPLSRQPVSPQSPERKRDSPIRQKRKRVRALFALAAFSLFLVLAYGLHYLSYLPPLTIGAMSIGGTKVVPADALHDFVEERVAAHSHGFISGRNIFMFDTSDLESDILIKFPRIRTVRVSRTGFFDNTLVIEASERISFAKWCLSGDPSKSGTPCFLMDRDGFIFALADPTNVTEYSFLGSLSLTSDPIGLTYGTGHFPGILSLLDLLGQAGFSPTGASIVDDRDVLVSLGEGFYLKASFGESSGELVKNLKLVLSSDALKDKTKNLEYIDLRFGNRVYYKFKGVAETTE